MKIHPNIMNSPSFQGLLIGAVCSIALVVGPTVQAQQKIPKNPEGLMLPDLVNFSMQLMKAKQWQKALQFNEQAIKDEGDGALERWGPMFGTIYYRKGLCEMKLKKWDAAANSFQKCYRDFPNKPDAMNENEFAKRALFQWAKAEMGREDWQKALNLFKKFLAERKHPRDRFSQGDFFISRALCYYKLRQIVPGNQSFESALQNKLAYRVPDAAILNCFKEMVEAALDKENEQAIVDFINKNRGHIVTFDDEMYPFSGIILKLAQDSLKADMQSAAIMLYQLMPSTEAAIDRAKDVLEAIGQLAGVRSSVSYVIYEKAVMKARAERFKQEMDNNKSVEIIQLNAVAFMHEKNGNVRGAHAAYRQLEDYFPHAERREENLFNMTRTAFMVDGGANALPDAKKFLAEFPNSKHAPAIKRLMFASLFAEQRYEECVEAASQMIGQLPKGGKDHDLCLHVLGGSHFYLGNYETAKPLLDQHVTDYPESESKLASAYFHAANYYRQNDIAKAAELLDGFLKKYSNPDENPFLPFALLDRATVHYMNEENEPAIEVTTRLIKEFLDHSVEDQALNLRGNARLGLEDNKAALRDYKTALDVANRWEHEIVAAESLFSISDLMVTEGQDMKGDEGKARIREAMPYIQQFWERFGDDNPLRRQMAVMQIPVFVEFGRLDDALQQLRVIIAELAAEDNVAFMEKTIPHYTEAYMLAHTPKELQEHYRALDGIDLDMKAARALLAIEVITVFEKVAKKAQNEGDKRKAKAAVQNLFRDLKNQFDLNDLSSSILINVGDYLRTKTSAPREALPFYSKVLERKDARYKLDALNGRGFIYGLSSQPSDLEKALNDFRAVLAEVEDEDLKEEALYNIIKIHMAKKDFDKVIAEAKEFLDKKNKFSKLRRAQVFLLLGKAYEQSNKEDDAIGIYARVWATHTGTISASAPAMEAWMKIMWMRNKPGNERIMGDRQGAYEGGLKYINQTARFRDKMNAADLELWLVVEKLVKQYEANPAIKAKKKGDKQ